MRSVYRTILRCLLVYGGLIIALLPTWSVTSTDARLDAYVRATPKTAQLSIPMLASYLINPTGNQREKAYVIYRWVAGNISYDINARLAGRLSNSDADLVLKRRVAICEGYANIFRALAKAAGLDAAVVIGTCKDDPLAGSSANKNHAWNAIKIDGQWGLVDCTMGSGYLDGQLHFVRKIDNYYFLPSPEELIYDHFPEDEDWQLLVQPITRAQFNSFAKVSPAFFQYGLHMAHLEQGAITTKRSLSLTVDVPSDIVLIASIFQQDRKLPTEYAFAQRLDTQYTIDTVYPAPGDYQLRIFAKHADDPGGYNCVVEFSIHVTLGGMTSGFPTAYAKFTMLNARVQSPFVHELRADTYQSFSLDVPGAEQVIVVSGNDWIQLKRQGQHFSGQVVLHPGRIAVGIQQPGSEKVSLLLEYVVK